MEFTTSNYIEITGADLVEVAKKAYELSSLQGLGFLHAKDGPLPNADAQEIVDRYASGRIALSMDYVHGRAVKLSVYRDDAGRLYIRNQWYDHSGAQLDALIAAINPAVRAAA